MKQLASIAVAATLLCAVACSGKEDTPAQANRSESPQTSVAQAEKKAAAMTREEARIAAAANDKLSVVTKPDAQAPDTKAPDEPAAEPTRVATAEEGDKPAEPGPASATPPPADAPSAEEQTARESAARDITQQALIARGDAQFKAGRDYVVLTPAQRTSSPPEKIEITEVFMYGCPHCFSFEPFIDGLMQGQPPEANFVRMPAIFNPMAELHAKAFYAARALGIWEQLHTPIFREIHTNRNPLNTEDKLLDFIASQGVERASFANALRSFEVDSKVRDAKDLNRRYRIDSVPTMVINGKYVTSASLVRSEAKLRQVIDYLVSKEAQGL